MFNLTGSEIAFLVLIGLIILGPEKLPDAVRKFTKIYNEFRKVATGFQGEVKQALEEPMRELRGTSDAIRKAAGEIDIGLDRPESKPAAAATTEATPSVRRDAGLNFGNPSAKRQERAAREAETLAPEADE